MPDAHSGAHGRHAGTNIGYAVHVHQAVGTLARQAKQASRPVVFEAAGKDALTRTIQSGSNGVAGACLDRLASEFKRDGVGGFGHDSSSGEKRFENFVGDSVSHRLHPLTATGVVIPPFLLDPGLVGLRVGVTDPLLDGGIRRGALLHLATKTEFVDTTIAAMRTTQEERHGARLGLNSKNLSGPCQRNSTDGGSFQREGRHVLRLEMMDVRLPAGTRQHLNL